MDKQKLEIKNKLKQIASVTKFNNLLNDLMASDEEKQILIMHYKEKKSLSYIADMLGMSISSIKNKHNNLLERIGKLL